MTAGDRSGVERTLQRFIVEELLDTDLYDGGDPLAGGEVDSLGLEQLAEYVEEEFGVELGDEEMVEENFESVPVLAALVDSKLRGAPL
jgi:acyl carrier protein